MTRREGCARVLVRWRVYRKCAEELMLFTSKRVSRFGLGLLVALVILGGTVGDAFEIARIRVIGGQSDS